MATSERLLEIGGEPNPLFHLGATKKVLTLSNKLVSAELNVLVEQVATKHLLSVLVVDEVADHKEGAKSGLCHERHISVVEHDVIFIQMVVV